MKIKFDNYEESRNRIQQMKESVSLIDLVDSYIGDLTPKGTDHIGRCPFHDDSNPSLSVNEDVYHCFTCKAKGDHITFIKEIENCDMKTAVEKLTSFFDGSFDKNYVIPFKSNFMEQLNSIERMITLRIGDKRKTIPFSFWDHYDDTLAVIDKTLWEMAEEYHRNVFPEISPRRKMFLRSFITREQDAELLILLDAWYIDIDKRLKKLGV